MWTLWSWGAVASFACFPRSSRRPGQTAHAVKGQKESQNCQWEVAGIAGTSTPSPATSDCQLGTRLQLHWNGQRPGAFAPSLGASPCSRRCKDCLLDFDGRACGLEVLLHLRGVVLRRAFLHDATGLGEVLGFLQAEARDRADGLDDFDLLLAG